MIAEILDRENDEKMGTIVADTGRASSPSAAVTPPGRIDAGGRAVLGRRSRAGASQSYLNTTA